MPHIIHALTAAMSTLHAGEIAHCDLHRRNVVLNFTRDNVCCIGIIDFGMMLIIGMRCPKHNYKPDFLDVG